MNENTFVSEAEGMKEELTEIRRQIHKHPELGLETVKTADLVMEKLQEIGYMPERIGSNSVTATVGTGEG